MAVISASADCKARQRAPLHGPHEFWTDRYVFDWVNNTDLRNTRWLNHRIGGWSTEQRRSFATLFQASNEGIYTHSIGMSTPQCDGLRRQLRRPSHCWETVRKLFDGIIRKLWCHQTAKLAHCFTLTIFHSKVIVMLSLIEWSLYSNRLLIKDQFIWYAICFEDYAQEQIDTATGKFTQHYEQSSENDRFKIRPVIDCQKEKVKTVCIPEADISIDESWTNLNYLKWAGPRAGTCQNFQFRLFCQVKFRQPRRNIQARKFHVAGTKVMFRSNVGMHSIVDNSRNWKNFKMDYFSHIVEKSGPERLCGLMSSIILPSFSSVG